MSPPCSPPQPESPGVSPSRGDSARPDVSVIIVSYNTRELTLECLRSVYAQTRDVTFEVFVVDNASADGSAAAIAAEFPQVHLIANADNRGFAAANNQALRLARGRYFLLLNPDTLVLENAIGKMTAYMDAHPDVGIAGCQVLIDEHTVQQTCFRFPNPWLHLLRATGLPALFPRSAVLNPDRYGGWQRDSERDVEVVSGMFLMVRRKAVEQIGLMDEDYFVYAEEADWCFRFRRHGWCCRFTPVARIIHRDGGSHSTRQVSAQMFVQQQKSVLIFHRKNRGWWSWALAKVLFTLSMLPRYVIFRLRSAATRDSRAAHRAHCARAALSFHLSGRPVTP